MIKHLKPILASGFAALLIAGSAISQSPPAQAQAAEQADDQAITAKVTAAIAADPTLKGSEITVETVDGEVSLNGYVGKPADAEKAAAITRGVSGVKGVKNGLKAQ